MRSIQRRFNNISRANKNWSSFLCFARAVKGQSFSKRALRYWFYRLVEKSDYSLGEKRIIFEYLLGVTNTIEDCTKSTPKASHCDFLAKKESSTRSI